MSAVVKFCDGIIFLPVLPWLLLGTLAEDFDLPRLILKRRGDLKVAYKQACSRDCETKKRLPIYIFWRNIFGDKDGFLECMRSGGS